MSEKDIEEMFSFADKDNDGKISYKVNTKYYEVNGDIFFFLTDTHGFPYY